MKFKVESEKQAARPDFNTKTQRGPQPKEPPPGGLLRGDDQRRVPGRVVAKRRRKRRNGFVRMHDVRRAFRACYGAGSAQRANPTWNPVSSRFLDASAPHTNGVSLDRRT